MCHGRPFGVDLLVHGHDGSVMGDLLDVFAEYATAFISGRGHPSESVIQAMHDRKLLVGSVAGKREHAESAVRAGVDFVIVQGTEGGGHTGQIPLQFLLPQVIDAVGAKVPVVAAGGIYDGRGLASALAVGADGVWLGTRFLMCEEARTHPCCQDKLVEAGLTDTQITRAFTGATLRALRTEYVEEYETQQEKEKKQGSAQLVQATRDGMWRHYALDDLKQDDGNYQVDFDVDNQAYPAGMVCGLIDSIVPAAQVVESMTTECLSHLQRVGALVPRSKL